MILPGWISVDTENSRLVGAAGVFSGATKAAANAAAQSALDIWAAAALEAGNLYCASPCQNPASFTWNITIENTYGPVTASAVGGSGSFNARVEAVGGDSHNSSARFQCTINNPGGSDCNYRFAGLSTVTSDGNIDSFGSVYFPGFSAFTQVAIANSGPMNWSVDFTVPAGGSYNFDAWIFMRAEFGPPTNFAQAIGTFTIVPI